MSQYRINNPIPLFENFCRRNQVDGKSIEIEVGGNPIMAKVASTPRSQAEGYMGTKEAPKDGEGMLFVYDDEAPLNFWMKNVPFDLDIIFFDSNLNYVGHKTMKKHGGEPDHMTTRYSSEKPARFAVETRAGWCKDNAIGANCRLKI